MPGGVGGGGGIQGAPRASSARRDILGGHHGSGLWEQLASSTSTSQVPHLLRGLCGRSVGWRSWQGLWEA